MNKKPDRTMLYIAGSVILLVIAIAATSLINSKPSSETDIRARASLQTGLVYEGIVNSIDVASGTISVDSLQPMDNGMVLSGVWNVQVPSNVSLGGISVGSKIQLTVDSKTFNIQTKTMGAKKVEVK